MAVTLSARPRTERGKNAARVLRREHRIPAVVYGHGDETRHVSLDRLELERLLSTINADTAIIDLAIEGGAPVRALIRELQKHPYRTDVLHVDFLIVHANEVLRVDIPVRLTGSPQGVVIDGGVLDQVLYSLEVECLPGDIPDVFDVDVSQLGVGDAVRVREIEQPRVKILQDGDQVVATVAPPTVAALPAEGEEAATPEVIRGRKPEDEE